MARIRQYEITRMRNEAHAMHRRELDAMRQKLDEEYAAQLQQLRVREDELRVRVQRREQARNVVA